MDINNCLIAPHSSPYQVLSIDINGAQESLDSRHVVFRRSDMQAPHLAVVALVHAPPSNHRHNRGKRFAWSCYLRHSRHDTHTLFFGTFSVVMERVVDRWCPQPRVTAYNAVWSWCETLK